MVSTLPRLISHAPPLCYPPLTVLRFDSRWGGFQIFCRVDKTIGAQENQSTFSGERTHAPMAAMSAHSGSKDASRPVQARFCGGLRYSENSRDFTNGKLSNETQFERQPQKMRHAAQLLREHFDSLGPAQTLLRGVIRALIRRITFTVVIRQKVGEKSH